MSDEHTTLTDPGLPGGNLTQLSYEGFKACGLTVLSYGALPLQEHVRLLLAQAPAFRRTEVRPMGGGIIDGDDRKLWIGLEGPLGSVVAFYALGSDTEFAEFIQHSVLKPMSTLPSPLQFGIGTVGARVPSDAAAILAGAHAVMLWELEQFADQRPADELDVPPALAADLAQRGWERFTDNGFKTDIPVGVGRTLVVFFTPYDAHSFTLMAPIDRYVAVPEHVRTRSYAPPYVFDTVGDTAVLRQSYPTSAPLPTAATLIDDAHALATYTHSQFSTAETAPAETPRPSPNPTISQPTPQRASQGPTVANSEQRSPIRAEADYPQIFTTTGNQGARPSVPGGLTSAPSQARANLPLLIGSIALAVVAVIVLIVTLRSGDHAPVAGTLTTSNITATPTTAPVPENSDEAALSRLTDLVATDRAAIDASLINVWQPQLSSKRPGLFADGINWAPSDILREHMQLRQMFPNARLLWSGDWPVFSEPNWWVTVSGVPFSSGEDANAWCASQGFDRDHCFAKLLSHDRGPSGTTLMQQ